jgi:hypothetical protein
MKLDNYWTREQTKRKNKILASQLEISFDLLIQTEWDIIEYKNDDGYAHSFSIKFKNTKSEILKKIPNIDNNEVFVSLFVDYDEDFVDYQDKYENLISFHEPHGILYSQIFNLRQLNHLYIEDYGMLQIQKRQIFISGIGVLEIFLLDTFISVMDSDVKYLKKFISNYIPFREKKINFNSIYVEFENIQETVKNELFNIIFHNLGRIKPIFESTFGIDFPSIKKMSKYINIRHDLVHRNGKQKDGNELNINENNVNELLSEIMNFANEITKKLNLDNI